MGVGVPSNRVTRSSSGCFSGALKLLMCKGSLKEHHQTDDDIIIAEPKTTSSRRLNKVAELKPTAPAIAVTTSAAAAPGVVARLMGLDSLPLHTKWVGPLEDAVRRSRSVNFMDYLLIELDYSKPQKRVEEEVEEGVVPRHRRVRTSVSFREVPGPLTPRKQNHLVVLLNDSKERATKKRYPEVGSRQKPKGVKKEKNEHGEGARVPKSNPMRRDKVSSATPTGCVSKMKVPAARKSEAKGPMLKPVNEKEVIVESKFMKRMKNQKKKKKQQNGRREVDEVSVLSCEGSSPVSVFDLKESSRRRPRQLAISEDVRLKGPSSEKESSSRNKKAGGKGTVGSRDVRGMAERRGVEEYQVELERKLWELTESEIKECHWVEKKASSYEFQDLEEICSEFGSYIFDHLLFQVVQELLVASTIDVKIAV